MEEGYPESLLRKLLEIYSPSGHEEAISKFLEEEMSRLGFAVKRDDIGNVEARGGSGRPKILLCGHMDTVEGFLDVKKKGKVLFGRGAVDAKAPLTALICAGAKHINERGIGTIVVLGVVDEEGKSRGMKHFISKTKDTFDYAIFGEPSSAYAVTVGYKGRLVFKINCRTTPGHASAPQLFENAIYVALRLIERLHSLELDWNKVQKNDGELFNKPTMCVTMIKGGLQDNTVPGNCEFTVDIRVPPVDGIVKLKKRIIELIETFKPSEPRAEIDFEFIDENEPFQEKPNSMLVKVFTDSILKTTGKEGRLVRKTGTSDVNDFANRFNVSAVVYGPGNSKLDHTPLENVSVEELKDSIDILTEVLKNITANQ